MSLDLTSLRNAVRSFDKSLKHLSGLSEDDDFFETMRAGVIQNFEFTFELCRKFMRRWLENNPGLLGSDIITNKVIFRLSAQEKLIDNPVEWFRFQEARNISSHTYDEEKAEKVLKVAIEFLPSTKQFLSNLERAND